MPDSQKKNHASFEDAAGRDVYLGDTVLYRLGGRGTVKEILPPVTIGDRQVISVIVQFSDREETIKWYDLLKVKGDRHV